MSRHGSNFERSFKGTPDWLMPTKASRSCTSRHPRPWKSIVISSLLRRPSQKLKRGFEAFFFQKQKEKYIRVKDLDLSSFSWKSEGDRIVALAKDAAETRSLEQWIQFFQKLMTSFGEFSGQIRKEYQEELDRVASLAQVKIRQDQALVSWLEENFKQGRSGPLATGRGGGRWAGG